MSRLRQIVLLALIVVLGAPLSVANGQDRKPQPGDEQKPEQIIQRAIEVYGGPAYLNVRTSIGRGLYTTFRDGVSQVPTKFLDYIVYPNKERVEFTDSGTHIIQVNVADTGWIYNSATRNIKEQTPDQIEDFQLGVKTSIDYLLRGLWRKAGGKLTYVGRREAGLGKRNETIRLEYPDGFWIEYEFGARDGLPAKVIYVRKRKNPDSGEVEEFNEEDRLFKPIAIDGVTAPWVIDHFVNTKQYSRIGYESVEYNKPIPDSLFPKPAAIKGMK